MSLSDLSLEELKAEVKRREDATKRLPPVLADASLALLALIPKIHADLYDQASFQREVKDFEHDIYERVMTAIYGAPYFTWLRNRGF